MPLDTGGQIRFMSNNLLMTGVKTIVKSSEDPNFPYANALTDFRSRPFKFTGRFEVTALNNKIYFNDGSDKIATITIGEYTTRALMATAIQTALNAVSSGWTVTWNTTTKGFSFTGPTHILQFSNQTNAAWDMMGFPEIVNSASGTLRSSTEPRYHYPYEYLKWDFGYYPEMGFLAIIADSSKPLNISPQANIRLQASNIDDFVTPAIDVLVTAKERGVFKFLDDDVYNFRYWKLTIEDNFAENEIEIGNLYLGEYNKFKEHYNDQGATGLDSDRTEIGESESGQLYTYYKAPQREFKNVSLTALDQYDKDFLKDIFRRCGKRSPFYISIDPKLEITTNLDDTTFFCKFMDDIETTHLVRNLYNTRFEVKEWL